uniref:Iron hydrogenase small subunit domain-containing protein n=2 Tax=Amphora coffeiformis TaxID=265554 RepID=A0A7S3KY15_9STRA|mmetsp:Transcript_1129/g.2278  ORF Transcript_1129/g.2278 Transcript_1129/m.2278 type:complete len:467 (-) Transcript_1129:168-1568(-)|eukprot:scaffold6439_cov167-Amphora_coffeaeformis.AAC.3
MALGIASTILIFILLSLLLTGEVECFTPLITARTKIRNKVEVFSSITNDPVSPPKEEKLSKEATELLHVLEHRKEGYDIFIAQTAPSVRVCFSEEFGYAPGAFPPGLLVGALKKLGFDMVLDMNTSADMTICEEATELLHRIQTRLNENDSDNNDDEQHRMPLFSSCCPGWLNFVEKFEPELAKDISTCKSPQQMYGSVIKEYSQELLQHPADKVYVCGIMPCVLKKGEADRPVFVRQEDDIKEIDNVITTRDLGVLLRRQGIYNPQVELKEANFDSPFAHIDQGAGTGAGQIFGATGGVTEAAVRTIYEWVTGEPLPGIEFHAVRGLEGIKEATVPLYSKNTKKGLQFDLKVVVANGLKEAKTLVQKIKNGEVQYDFVEVMSCPGGCIGGGGQPRGIQKDVIPQRLDVIYQLDRSLPRRRSHENPTLQALYDQYLGEYGSDKAHKILHVEPVYGEIHAEKYKNKK